MHGPGEEKGEGEEILPGVEGPGVGVEDFDMGEGPEVVDGPVGAGTEIVHEEVEVEEGEVEEEDGKAAGGGEGEDGGEKEAEGEVVAEEVVVIPVGFFINEKAEAVEIGEGGGEHAGEALARGGGEEVADAPAGEEVGLDLHGVEE